MTARCVLYYNTILARGACRPRCIPLHTGAFRHRAFLRRSGELGRSPMNRRRWTLPAVAGNPIGDPACTRDSCRSTGGGAFELPPVTPPMTNPPDWMRPILSRLDGDREFPTCPGAPSRKPGIHASLWRERPRRFLPNRPLGPELIAAIGYP
jgi:hypothetical protein